MLARRVLLAGLVVVMIGGVVWWLCRDASPAAAAPTPASASVVERAASELPTASPTVDDARVQVAGSPAPALAAATTPVPTFPAFRLHGSVEVLDARGVALAPIDGRLELSAWGAQYGERLECEFHAGAWSVVVQRRASVTHLTIISLATDGRPLFVEAPRGEIPFPPDGRLDIRARAPSTAVLRVVDSLLGFDLDRLEVVRCADDPNDGARHPGIAYAERTLSAHASSPIMLSGLLGEGRERGIRPLLIGAEGYAWTRVPIDFDLGGERLVALELGGDLEVSVRGVTPKQRPELRIRAKGERQPDAFVPVAADGTLTLRGLAAREFEVSAELGAWYETPLSLGKVSATVVAGETTTVTLELAPVPKVELLTASGRLLVPKSWGVLVAPITFELRDTPLGVVETHQVLGARRAPTSTDEFDVFEWRFAKLQAGRHEFVLGEPPFSSLVDVESGTANEFELRVPPPVDIVVRVVDARTGANVEGVKVLWSPARRQGAIGGSLKIAQHYAGTVTYTIRAPNVPIELRVWDWRYLPYTATLDPSAGEREHTVRLEPACGLELVLRDGDASVPVPEESRGTLEPAEGTTGAGALMTIDHGVLRIMVTAPGTYTLQPPKLDGYEAPPLQRIEVRPAEFTKHVVQLEREHR